MTAFIHREQSAAGGLSCTDKGNKKKLIISQSSSMLSLLLLCKTDGQDQQPCQDLEQPAWVWRPARDLLRKRSWSNPAVASVPRTQCSEQKRCLLHGGEELALPMSPSTDQQKQSVTLTYWPLRLPWLLLSMCHFSLSWFTPASHYLIQASHSSLHPPHTTHWDGEENWKKIKSVGGDKNSLRNETK